MTAVEIERADTVADRMTSSAASDSPGVALAVHDVSRHLGDRDVVDHVSFEVADGELMVLVGPVGAASPPCCGSLLASTLRRRVESLSTAAT